MARRKTANSTSQQTLEVGGENTMTTLDELYDQKRQIEAQIQAEQQKMVRSQQAKAAEEARKHNDAIAVQNMLQSMTGLQEYHAILEQELGEKLYDPETLVWVLCAVLNTTRAIKNGVLSSDDILLRGYAQAINFHMETQA